MLSDLLHSNDATYFSCLKTPFQKTNSGVVKAIPSINRYTARCSDLHPLTEHPAHLMQKSRRCPFPTTAVSLTGSITLSPFPPILCKVLRALNTNGTWKSGTTLIQSTEDSVAQRRNKHGPVVQTSSEPRARSPTAPTVPVGHRAQGQWPYRSAAGRRCPPGARASSAPRPGWSRRRGPSSWPLLPWDGRRGRSRRSWP